MFIDEVTITVEGGKGGNGCVAWRREKFVAKGGPNGGDGGRGGNVVFVVDENTDTLADFSSTKRFEAPDGKPGSGQNRHGRDGENLVLRVPPGTQISQLEKDSTLPSVFVADLWNPSEELVIAKGGRGGYGNAHFVSSVRQAPDFAELGENGEFKSLRLELKLVADVGIIGYPSVGKSTLIAAVSNARPKIAAYEFTTLVPNLGVVNADDRSFIICDIPGLIEGASEGKGLGGTFLKHIERCGVLLHVLDLERASVARNTEGEVAYLDDNDDESKNNLAILGYDGQKLINDYKAIRKELEAYSPTLAVKRELVVLNKIDLVYDDDRKELINSVRAVLQAEGIKLEAAISAAAHTETSELMRRLLPIILEEREKRRLADSLVELEPVVLRPGEESSKTGVFNVAYNAEQQVIIVYGKRIEQIAAMTNFSSEGGIRRLKNIIDRSGVKKAVERMRKDYPEVPVFIGDISVTHLF